MLIVTYTVGGAVKRTDGIFYYGFGLRDTHAQNKSVRESEIQDLHRLPGIQERCLLLEM